MLVLQDRDFHHRPTLRWIERLANSNSEAVDSLADSIRVEYPGREADGIYEALEAVRYVSDEKIATALKKKFRNIKSSAEVLQAPAMLLRTRFGDCDDMVILGGALANKLSLPYRIILHRDLDKPTWHHVYLTIRDSRGWRAVDRVYGHGPGVVKPGVVAIVTRKKGGHGMPVTVTVGAREIPSITETLVRPLVTTEPGLVELSGLGNDEPPIVPGARTTATTTDKEPTRASRFLSSSTGQALTAAGAAIIGAFTNRYTAKIGSSPIPVGTIAPPIVAPAKAVPWGIIAVLAAAGIGGAVYFSRR